MRPLLLVGGDAALYFISSMWSLVFGNVVFGDGEKSLLWGALLTFPVVAGATTRWGAKLWEPLLLAPTMGLLWYGAFTSGLAAAESPNHSSHTGFFQYVEVQQLRGAAFVAGAAVLGWAVAWRSGRRRLSGRPTGS